MCHRTRRRSLPTILVTIVGATFQKWPLSPQFNVCCSGPARTVARSRTNIEWGGGGTLGTRIWGLQNVERIKIGHYMLHFLLRASVPTNFDQQSWSKLSERIQNDSFLPIQCRLFGHSSACGGGMETTSNENFLPVDRWTDQSVPTNFDQDCRSLLRTRYTSWIELKTWPTYLAIIGPGTKVWGSRGVLALCPRSFVPSGHQRGRAAGRAHHQQQRHAR